MKSFFALIAALLITTTAIPAFAGPQSQCPVMGGSINKNLYVDHNGKRVYVCCAGCVQAVKAAPEKFIAQLEEQGVELETVDE